MPLFDRVRSILDGVWRATRSVLGGAAGDEIKPLDVSVATDRIDPETDAVIPVEVTVPSARRADGEGWPFAPSEAVLGLTEAFETGRTGQSSPSRRGSSLAWPDRPRSPTSRIHTTMAH